MMPSMGRPNLPGTGSQPGTARGSGDGAEKPDESEPVEPRFLTVPRFDFTVQLVWKETLRTERLEKQAKAWQEKAPAGAAAGNAELAVNTGGGA